MGSCLVGVGCMKPAPFGMDSPNQELVLQLSIGIEDTCYTSALPACRAVVSQIGCSECFSHLACGPAKTMHVGPNSALHKHALMIGQ